MSLENKNYALVISAIVSAFLLISFEIEQAYADISLVTITPTNSTYGTLDATSDCSDITSGNGVSDGLGVIWVGCNNIVYAIDYATNTIIANVTQTTSVNNVMLATVSGTGMLINEVSTNSIKKYQYSANTIVLTGQIFSTAVCTISGTNMNYDELGFVWVVCSVEDRIMRFNPSTMTQNTLSQDLTDGVGLECDNPDFVSYSTSDNIGVIHCATTNNYVTFTRVSSTSITLLDDNVDGASEDNVMIDANTNRFIVSRGDGINVFSYNPTTGIITLSQSGLGNTVGYSFCDKEPYTPPTDIFILCTILSGSNTLVDTFFSNSTQVFHIATNTVSSFPSLGGLGFDIQEQTWFISGGTNNQRYIKITGTRTIVEPPTPIEPPEDEADGGGNAINGTCQNTDANGDGISGGVLDCVGNSGGLNSLTGGQPVINSTNTFCQGIGLCDQNNDDPQTNGAGLILMLLMGSFFAIALMNGARKTGFSLSDLPKEVWLFLVVAIVAFSWFVHWIPDIVFYGLCVGLAGLFAFGVYKHIGSRGG